MKLIPYPLPLDPNRTAIVDEVRRRISNEQDSTWFVLDVWFRTKGDKTIAASADQSSGTIDAIKHLSGADVLDLKNNLGAVRRLTWLALRDVSLIANDKKAEHFNVSKQSLDALLDDRRKKFPSQWGKTTLPWTETDKANQSEKKAEDVKILIDFIKNGPSVRLPLWMAMFAYPSFDNADSQAIVWEKLQESIPDTAKTESRKKALANWDAYLEVYWMQANDILLQCAGKSPATFGKKDFSWYRRSDGGKKWGLQTAYMPWEPEFQASNHMQPFPEAQANRFQLVKISEVWTTKMKPLLGCVVEENTAVPKIKGCVNISSPTGQLYSVLLSDVVPTKSPLTTVNEFNRKVQELIAPYMNDTSPRKYDIDSKLPITTTPTINMKTPIVTKPTLIEGQDIAKMTDDSLIGTINSLQARQKQFTDMKIKSKRIEKFIAELQEGIDACVTELDSREDGESVIS